MNFAEFLLVMSSIMSFVPYISYKFLCKCRGLIKFGFAVFPRKVCSVGDTGDTSLGHSQMWCQQPLWLLLAITALGVAKWKSSQSINSSSLIVRIDPETQPSSVCLPWGVVYLQKRQYKSLTTVNWDVFEREGGYIHNYAEKDV